MKLSPGKRKILERMAKGDEVWTLTGISPSAFWHNAIGDRSPRLDSVRHLYNAGLLEQYDKDWRGAKYVISPEGRAALKPNP